MIRLPRVHVCIPGLTSRHRFCPIYEFPLLKRKWAKFLDDPEHPVAIQEMPAGVDDCFRWIDVAGIQQERDRLTAEYGDLFDIVYQGYDFDEAFRRALGQSAVAENKQLVEDVAAGKSGVELTAPPEIMDLKVPGMTDKIAIDLELNGLGSVDAIKEADLVKLAAVPSVGPGLAQRLIDAVNPNKLADSAVAVLDQESTVSLPELPAKK